MATAFAKTLSTFCNELRLTFPEFGPRIDRVTTMTASLFWKGWQGDLEILLNRDMNALIEKRRGLLVGPVQMTASLWSEISENTRAAIWRYLRTLTLESVLEIGTEGLSAETMQLLMDIMTAERLEAGGTEAEAAASEMFEESMGHLKPLMEKLKGMMGGFMDLSGLSDIPMPEIPERLRNGRIAKLAEELAKTFDPSEFGIDPALMKSDNAEAVLKGLAEMYQRDPTMLIAGARRVAEKIKNRVLNGSIKREELLAEAQEFVALLKDHPLFKEAIDKFQGMVGGADGLSAMFGGAAGAGAPSERLRTVQERLRKKMAARKAGQK